MSTLHRHRLFVLLLWLALAWLPLRGVAQVLMHPAVAAEAAAAAPCHGAHGQAHVSHDEAGGQDGSACALCDLCHGAALHQTATPIATESAPPRMTHVPALQGERPPQRLDRPPRG